MFKKILSIGGLAAVIGLTGCETLQVDSQQTKLSARVTINDCNKPKKMLCVPDVFNNVYWAWDLNGDGSIDEVIEFNPTRKTYQGVYKGIIDIPQARVLEIIKQMDAWEWSHLVAKGFRRERQYLVINEDDPFATYVFPESSRERLTILNGLIQQENTPSEIALLNDKERFDVVWAWDLDGDGDVDEVVYSCNNELMLKTKERAKELLLFELSLDSQTERIHFVAKGTKPEKQYIKTHTNTRMMHPNFRKYLTKQYHSDK